MNPIDRSFEQFSSTARLLDFGFAGLGRISLEPNPVVANNWLEMVAKPELSPVEMPESFQRTILFDSGPSNYVRPDEFVLDDLAKALAEDPLINSWNLQIACNKGHVRIQGHVSTQAARKRLEVLLASIHGVKDADISDVKVSKDVEPVEKANAQQKEDK